MCMARGCCGCRGLKVSKAGTGALQWEEGQGTRHKDLEFKALIAFFFNLVFWGGVMGPRKSVPAVVLVFFLFFF